MPSSNSLAAQTRPRPTIAHTPETSNPTLEYFDHLLVFTNVHCGSLRCLMSRLSIGASLNFFIEDLGYFPIAPKHFLRLTGSLPKRAPRQSERHCFSVGILPTRVPSLVETNTASQMRNTNCSMP